MSDLKTSEITLTLIDPEREILVPGQYAAGFIIKMKGDIDSVIISDNLQIDHTFVRIQGLHIGIVDGKVYSEEKETVISNMAKIDYCVRLLPEIVSEFDTARFSASYPNIIRFLKTTCLFLDTIDRKINHMEFVTGEILNRPVAVTRNNGIIIGDRLVIDEQQQLIFYDAILIGRKAERDLQMTYEHFITIPLSALKYVVLLGTENF